MDSTPEIRQVLRRLPRQKFAKRLAEKQLSIPAIVERYRVLADIVEPAVLSGPVSRDPDDDLVLATALAANAELIVSRDKHLRNLKHFHGIPVVAAADALARITQASAGN